MKYGENSSFIDGHDLILKPIDLMVVVIRSERAQI